MKGQDLFASDTLGPVNVPHNVLERRIQVSHQLTLNLVIANQEGEAGERECQTAGKL